MTNSLIYQIKIYQLKEYSNKTQKIFFVFYGLDYMNFNFITKKSNRYKQIQIDIKQIQIDTNIKKLMSF